MSLAIASNNKIATGTNEVVDQLNISEKLNEFLSDGDRRYLKSEGENIGVLAAHELSLNKAVQAAQAKLRETPEFKKLEQLKQNRKQTRILIDEKTIKVLGVVERALQDTRKGVKLIDKMNDLLTLPAPKALKEKN